MSLVITNQLGEILFLQYIVGLVEAGNPVIHLYGNMSTDPVKTTVIGNLVECTSSGYAPITLISANWTVNQDGDGVTTAFYSDQSFTFATEARVYGYFVTDTAGHLLWAEKFAGAPIDVPADGGSITVEPTITIR